MIRTSHREYISPLLLPYILADREAESLRRLEEAASTPVDTVPFEAADVPQRASKHGESDSPRVSPDRTTQKPSRGAGKITNHLDDDHSPPAAAHHSMIEASINELTFDPDLTFMNSPAFSNATDERSPARFMNDDIHNDEFSAVSYPTLPAPIETTIVVPVHVTEEAVPTQLIESSSPTGKESQKTDDARPKRRKTVNRVVEEESAGSAQLETSGTSSASTRMKQAHVSAKESEVSAPVAPKRKTDASLSSPKRRKVHEVVEEVSEPVLPESGKSTKNVKSSEIESTKSTGRAKSSAPKRSAISRQSPRFASRVLSSSHDIPPLLSCPSCGKAYKRERDFQKHVAGCK